MAGDKLHPAEQYALDVVEGNIVTGKWVRKACERHINDMETGPDRGLWFSEPAAQHVLDFFGYLRHSKGEWAGRKFELSPWQQFSLWCLFGWMGADGLRRFRVAYFELARKNGKTTMLAGIGLYLFFADDEPGAEVYSAATKREQARLTHGEAVRMVKKSPALKSRIRIYRDNLHVVETESKFEPLGADSDTADGLNMSGGLVDELHAHKQRGMWDVLDTATGARRQPMLIAITTAGFDRYTVCYEQHEYSEKILDGIIEDDTFFAFIAAIDEKDDWRDEKVWIKANPNLGISVKIGDLRRKCKKAIEQPSSQNAFRRLHMDEWTESETLWLEIEQWRKATDAVDIESLRGKKCYGGLDLSSTGDITALVLVFPDGEGGYDVLCYFWVPGESMIKRWKKDRVPYPVWEEQGFIEKTEGNVVDYDRIQTKMAELSEIYDIHEVAYDRWNSTQIVTNLLNDGADMVPLGQGYASMSAPSKEVEKLVQGSKIRHGNNPVLTWMASNTVIQTDAAGNIKPAKDKSSEKIDGIVGMIMGVAMAIAHKEDDSSPYEKRGLRTL